MGACMKTYKELLDEVTELVQDTTISPREFKKRAEVCLYMADRFGVRTEVERLLNSRQQNTVKTAASQYDYTKLPLRSKEEVKVAAQWFVENRDRFEYSTRKKQAVQILKAADKFGVNFDKDTEETLHKSAGLGLANRQIIRHELTKRAEYLKNTGKETLATVINNIIAEMDKMGNDAQLQQRQFTEKLAHFVDSFDRRFGIVFKYKKEFTIPEDFIYAESLEPVYKVASLVGNVKTGKYYDPKDISRLDLSRMANLLGETFEKSASVAGITVDIEGLKNWLKTATPDQAKLFDALANEQGVYHVAEKIPEA